VEGVLRRREGTPEGLNGVIPPGVAVFPVRHHSPRSSAALKAFLDALRPRAVLVEGPSDATPLLDVLLDPDTEPPVAILGYRTDGPPASALWPFATYSPEYVALRWARDHDAAAELIDIPVGQALAGRAEPEEDAESAPEESFGEACARTRGFRSFEEFWEASFEAPDYEAESFREALLAWADVARGERARPEGRGRDAAMARRIGEVVASGVPAERVAVVVGAAHAAAFVAGDVDFSAESRLPAPVAAASTLVPFSFPRLAGQLGYGAGNRAPRYYQRAHDAGCDYTRATLEALVELTEHLRLRGFSVSLADTLEAYRLALMLAQIRGKAAPGLDELREAAVSTLCRGDATHVGGFLWPGVVGRSVGRVASRIGRNSLQEEFWSELRARRLPRSDSPESFVLRLDNETEVGTSVFLHRLRVAGIPYASFQGRSARGGAGEEAAGGAAALQRGRESWEAQWTPATDVALVERIVLGDSLLDVATHVLDDRLAQATATGAAAEVLLEAVVVATPRPAVAALEACERLSAVDDDVPSLAQACDALAWLLRTRSFRVASSPLGASALEPLLARTFARAVLRVPAACDTDDAGLEPMAVALRRLHAVALPGGMEREAWFAAARELAESYAVNPRASGLACGLLYTAQALTDEELATRVAQRLSNHTEPLPAAAFLAGFLEVDALTLVRSRPLVAALDGFLVGLDPERFRDALPTLRRALAPLGSTERRYLVETLVAVRGIGTQAHAARSVLQEKDKQALQSMAGDLSDLMDDL
jgi:hypothetical protein